MNGERLPVVFILSLRTREARPIKYDIKRKDKKAGDKNEERRKQRKERSVCY